MGCMHFTASWRFVCEPNNGTLLWRILDFACMQLLHIGVPKSVLLSAGSCSLSRSSQLTACSLPQSRSTQFFLIVDCLPSLTFKCSTCSADVYFLHLIARSGLCAVNNIKFSAVNPSGSLAHYYAGTRQQTPHTRPLAPVTTTNARVTTLRPNVRSPKQWRRQHITSCH